MRDVMERLLRLPAEILLLPVRFYRRFLSPLKAAPTCRFTPTCSAYCIEALREWGILCGTALTIWRVLRCNPFSAGGPDPVPPCPWRRHVADGKAAHDAPHNNK